MDNEEFKSQVNIAFDRIHDLNSTYDANLSNTLTENKASSKILYWIALGPFIVSLIIILCLAIFGKIPSFAFSALILVSISYSGMLIFQLALLIESRNGIITFFKNPLTMILDRVKDETILDHNKLSSLADTENEVINQIRRHLISEKESFERRVGVLVGALEKVGLIPGLVTLYLAWAKVMGKSISVDPWLAVSVFTLYFIAFYCHHLFSRMERYIGTIDEIIEYRINT